MRFARGIAAVVVLVVLLLPAPARAEEEAASGALDLVTERVFVFKDGYGLFVKRASGVADEHGEVHTLEVPDAAVLGTFWAMAEDDSVVAMRAEWVETEKEVAHEVGCQTVAQLLEANVGVTVTLTLNLENRPRLTGKILSTPRPGVPGPQPVQVWRPDGQPTRGTTSEGPPPQLVVMEVGAEQIALPISSVQSVEAKLLSATRVVTMSSTERTKRLSFELGRDAAGKAANLRLFYFRPGIRWIPAYRLFGSWEGEAQLALQAEILNEAEDLKDVSMHLVVGVPNFRFRDVVSPLTLESVLRGAASASGDRQLAGQLVAQNRFSNTFQGQGGEAAEPSALDMAPELAGAGVQDLFLYDTPATSLAKGARATLPLWRADVPLQHRYTLEVTLDRDDRGRTRSRSSRSQERSSPLHLQKNDVWHQLELANGTQVPWTTGAALLMQDGKPVAQEILGYTAPGASSLVPITVATDLRANAWEEEVKRESNAINWGGYSWWRIHVVGHIELESFRRDTTPLRVKVAVDGSAEQSSEEGSSHRVEPTGHRVNPRSVLTWDLNLEKGKTRTITYRYTFYTR